MTETDEILALPLWLNGHAYLTMVPAFCDVCDARSGRVKRRTPLCGAPQALAVVESARAALPAWSARPVDARAALLAGLGDAVATLAGHFASLISEETGKDLASASSEVEAVVKLLRSATSVAVATAGVGVVGVVSDESNVFLGPLQRALPALLAGATVVFKPGPKAPSASFALAELAARSGVPGGVLNILHGDLAAIEGLCTAAAVCLLLFSGDPLLGARVAAIASRHGKPFVD